MGASPLGAMVSSTSGLLGPVGMLAAETVASGRGVESALMAAAELEVAILGQANCADGLRPFPVTPTPSS